jgi:hypothetical protein
MSSNIAAAPPCVLVARITTADLRAKLNRRRDGKDSRIIIECQRERRHNIEGRNLQGEFNSLTPA